MYDDQLHEGDEVLSVLLSVPNVTTLELGSYVLTTINILGMCAYIYMCMYMCIREYVYAYMCIYICV